tara:strand:- start:559 stop:3123 length:2565 start_codon:yes stop_codon:yes gene_type:complete
MANITLAGTLRDPNGDLAVGDKIRFTHKSTTGETVKSASSILTIDPTGVYSIDLEYGLILVEYKDARNSQFENLGVATVNGTNPATTIPELLNALVPVSSAELIEFQAILADCVAAKDAAEAAAATLDLINDLSQAYIFDTVAAFKASLIAFPDGKAIRIKEDNSTWDNTLTSSVTPDGEYTVASTAVPTQSIVQRDIVIPKGRDTQALTAPAFSLAELGNTCKIEKLRDTTYEEFAIYSPLTANGIYWQRWLFTNRFNVTNDGAPRMLMCTLAGLYPSVTVARTTANNVSEARAGVVATGFPKASSDGVFVGTWTGPATVLTTNDVKYSSTVGDTCTYTVTGAEELELRGLYAGNGGIALVKITESAVEIPEANYQLPTDHLINFISTATGNTTMHIPLANGLDSTKTYTVEIKVDVSNTDPVTNRVYQAGLLGYDDITFNAVGIHGIVLDASLDGQTNSLSVTSGTTAVYTFADTTKIDWQYVQTPTSSIVEFKVFDSVGTEITALDNDTTDQYATGSTAVKVGVASGLTKGTYYLHVINGKAKNASSSAYRYYDFGAISYDETTAGDINTDEFDNFDVPNNVQDPNNDIGNGTRYMLIGTGNLELAIDVRKTTDSLGVEEFVGGIHGHETTPVPVYSIDGAVIDFAAGVIGDTWIGKEVKISLTTTLLFPTDLSSFCTADYILHISQAGYLVDTVKTTIQDSIIHDDFSIMLNCPNTDTSQGIKQTQGLSVGGGFKYLSADKNYTLTAYDNSGVNIKSLQSSVAFANNEYSVVCNYALDPELDASMLLTPFQTKRDYSLVQDRTDRTLKFYTRGFNGNDSTGIEVPSGTTWRHTKLYRAVKGNIKSLVGFF